MMFKNNNDVHQNTYLYTSSRIIIITINELQNNFSNIYIYYIISIYLAHISIYNLEIKGKKTFKKTLKIKKQANLETHYIKKILMADIILW